MEEQIQPEVEFVVPEEPAPAREAPLPETPHSAGSALRGAFGVGLAFAVVGLLFGLRTLAVATLPHILQISDYIDYLEVLDGAPVPHLLDWNLFQIQVLVTLSDMSLPFRILFGALLFGLLWLLSVSVLNPTFRPLHLARVPRADGRLHRTFVSQPSHLRKAIRCLLAVSLPIAAAWLIAGFLDGIGTLLFCIVCGLALWFGFHPNGLAGDFGDNSIGMSPTSRFMLFLPGAVFGLGIYGATHGFHINTLEALLNRYQMFGTFHQGYFYYIAQRLLGSIFLCCLGLGFLLILLSRSGLKHLEAYTILFIAGFLFSFGGLTQVLYLGGTYIGDRDITSETVAAITTPFSQRKPGSGVPNGEPAAKELAKRIPISMGKQPTFPEQDILLFYPEVTHVRLSGISDDNLTLTRESAKPMEDYLAKKNYQTALSWVITKHLFNIGFVHFDPHASISACLNDMTRCPHESQTMALARSLLFTCAASPQNLALLDQWANEKDFVFNDREGVRMMGDLYRRFGETEKALKWYRRADMPKSFMAQIRTEPPNLHTGRVTGKLMLNGKPLAGVRVAILPEQLTFIPRDVGQILIRADRELVPDYAVPPFFPPFHPYPWAFRWFSAGTTTDAQGAFALDNLTDGIYILACALPPDIRLRLPKNGEQLGQSGVRPADSRLKVTNAPKEMRIAPQTPTIDCGTIAVTIAKARANDDDRGSFTFTPTDKTPPPPDPNAGGSP